MCCRGILANKGWAIKRTMAARAHLKCKWRPVRVWTRCRHGTRCPSSLETPAAHKPWVQQHIPTFVSNAWQQNFKSWWRWKSSDLPLKSGNLLSIIGEENLFKRQMECTSRSATDLMFEKGNSYSSSNYIVPNPYSTPGKNAGRSRV